MRSGLLSLVVLASLAANVQAALIHQYRLDGSLADDFAGPALVAAGGSLGPTSYSFGANQGLSLSSALPDAANYSIETIFKFTTTSGYRKILDFKDRTLDSGLYNLNTNLNFYPPAVGSSGFIVPNANVRVVVTRNDSTDQFIGYVNGVQQFAFFDTSNLGTFTGTNNIIQFFKDDFATGQSEASAGVVDLIRIYDAPLTSQQVANLGDVVQVPEPSTAFLFATGMSLLGFGRWMKGRRKPNSGTA